MVSISRIRKLLGTIPSLVSLLAMPMLLVALTSSSLSGQVIPDPVMPDSHPCPIPRGGAGLYLPTVYSGPSGARCDWRLDEEESGHKSEPGSDPHGNFVTYMGPMMGASPQQVSRLIGMASGLSSWMSGWAYDSRWGNISSSLQLSGTKTVRWYAVEESPYVKLHLYGKGKSQVEIVDPASSGYLLSTTTFESNLIGADCTSGKKSEPDQAQASTGQGGSTVGVGPFQLNIQGNFGAGVYPSQGWEWPRKMYECCMDEYTYESSMQIAGRVEADGYLYYTRENQLKITVESEAECLVGAQLYSSWLGPHKIRVRKGVFKPSGADIPEVAGLSPDMMSYNQPLVLPRYGLTDAPNNVLVSTIWNGCESTCFLIDLEGFLYDPDAVTPQRDMY